jgi:DNA uptake protein ComE-like DNA-binding protein
MGQLGERWAGAEKSAGGINKHPGGRVLCEKRPGTGPQRAAEYGSPGAQTFRIQGGSMSRTRIVGFLFIVFALAVSSVAIAQAKKQLDINTATEEEMVAIGIEKAAAKKIVDSRPYRNKSELVSKQLLTRTQYDKLKDLIVARQAVTIKEVPAKPAGK